MISYKHLNKIGVVLVALALAGCILAMVFSEHLSVWTATGGYSLEYPAKLFNTENLLEISISIEEDKWNEMLLDATQEEYYECDVEILGQTFYKVGIRPKGNTSLSSIARDPDNNRYSFKLEFDQFVDEQTCFGLDKLVLNNGYADTSNMKEAIIYDMYQFLDADAPLYNYAKITVNGAYWGTYLALEAVEESFLLRTYGTNQGKLYKPEGMGGGGMGGFSRGGGANLNYTDDSLDSYSTIWDGAVTDSTSEERNRVVQALKGISEGENPEQYQDVDNLLKYMAVHNFSVNEDSLSGAMAHNYYLYESNGKLNLIPWDYNLAFGGMHGGNATSMVNEPIDDSYSATDFFDALLENETYKTRYHKYYQKLVDEYFNGGVFDAAYQRIRSQIDSLMETDPTLMYSYEEYLTGADLLYEVLTLRKESVAGQLAGNIPATSKMQRNDSSALIDASHIDLSQLGQFMGGGRR